MGYLHTSPKVSILREGTLRPKTREGKTIVKEGMDLRENKVRWGVGVGGWGLCIGRSWRMKREGGNDVILHSNF